jgi:lipopolysaccharide biosynthesis glycosyltransferase
MNKKILLTTVTDNGYAIGSQVMIYSMSKNLKNFADCDVKIYYNDVIAPLSDKNKNIFKSLGDNIILEHVDDPRYLDAKVPYHQGRSIGSKASYLNLQSFSEYDYDKVIMFDADMLCIDDFSELFTSDYEFGIFGGNTGFVVLGNLMRTPETYEFLMSQIRHHNGDFMEQGLILKVASHIRQPLSSIYNQYKPIFSSTCIEGLSSDSTKILHWAHFDYLKPWAINDWKDKVELFQDCTEYPFIDASTGYLPNLACKPVYELWGQYKQAMFNKINN